MPILYLVGDSTVSSFKDPYYFPRFGYGTQIGNYLNSGIAVRNLALSGRSSKSFIDPADNSIYAQLLARSKCHRQPVHLRGPVRGTLVPGRVLQRHA